MSNESPASVLVDPSDGTSVRVVTNIGDRYVGVGAVQDVKTSTNNSSTAQLASGASFTGTFESTFGVASIQVCVYSDEPMHVSVQQSTDHVNWDIVDEYDLPPCVGDGRTTQAVAEFFRVVLTNLGPATTTELRLQSILCPTVEALPRSLTPLTGALKLSRKTRSFVPDPKNFQIVGEGRALTLDDERQLATRSVCLTDETSFRDDFASGAYTDLTGTCYFRNGQRHVVGVATSFLAEAKIGQLLKLSTDPDADLVEVENVFSDTDLYLVSAYPGSTGNGTGRLAYWFYVTGAGGSITVASSEMAIASGTTSGSISTARHYGDYLPFITGFRVKISQRIVNQEAHIGFLDDLFGLEQKQACLVFDGAVNTTVIFRTSFSGTDVEDTTVTLPNAGVTSDYHDYRIELTTGRAVLWIDNIKISEHRNHIPGPYDRMDLRIGINNTGVPASSTTLTTDAVWFENFNRMRVAWTPQAEPIPVQEQRSLLSTCTSVAAAAADTELLAYNANRTGAAVFNDSNALCYIKMGTGASTTSYTVRLEGNDYWEMPFQYVGPIHAYWASAAGAARVTELT